MDINGAKEEMNINKVLIIDDDKGIADVIAHFFEQKLLFSSHASCGQDALEMLQKERFSAVILDLNLPDIYGIELCKSIRKELPDIPILILSANTGEVNRIIGLEAEANDYMEKPFNIHELYARVNNLIKFSMNNTSNQTKAIIFNSLSYHLHDKTLSSLSNKINLTKTEQRLLELFLTRPGQVISKHEIADKFGMTDQSDSRSLDVIISRLRTKIDDKQANLLQTIRGHGYVFVGRLQYK